MTDRPGRPVLARGLGLFSLGLGAWQVLAPSDHARRTGLDDTAETRTLVRAVGLRELAVVPGLLLRAQPTGWLWARVAGDVMDLALLRGALDGKKGRKRELTLAATTAVAGVALVDLLAARRTGRRTSTLHLEASVTVEPSADEAYALWRDFANLPRFMTHLQEVRVDGRRSHWVAKAPLGKLSWDAETTEDVRGKRIAWRSVGRATVPHEGSVRFAGAPGGRGTEVRVSLTYRVPGGRAGATVARLLGEDPHQQVEDDLRRFKQVLETGDVVRSEGTPEGTRARRHLFQHPAQPVGKA